MHQAHQRGGDQKLKHFKPNQLYVVYARISPRPAENESIEFQIDTIRKEIQRRSGLVIGVFSDDRVTGTRSDKWKRGKRKGQDVRPGFRDAMACVKKNKATIAVYDIDRLSRNMQDSCRIISDLCRWQCGCITMAGLKIDTDSPEQLLQFHMLAAFSAYYAEKNRRLTSNAMLHYQNEGRSMGSLPPYGQQYDSHNFYICPKTQRNMKLLIDCPKEQGVICMIANLSDKGCGNAEIIKILHARGISTRAGRQFTFKMIRTILKREAADHVHQPTTQ